MFHSHRDARRRRRSLAEDWSTDTPASVAAAPASLKPTATPERYPAAARREHHLRTSDLIPRRAITISLLSLAAIALTAGLLYGVYAFGLHDREGDPSVAATLFETAHGGSLVGWFSSLLYLLAAVGCLQIYSIRRHRLDDYRGSYRLWLWAAACFSVMSIDATANLREPFAAAMSAATGWSLGGDISTWWLGGWSLLMSVLAVRLVLETRECRVAMAGTVLVFLLWIVAAAISRWSAPGSATAALLAEGFRIAGQLCLLFATAMYARHVLLDAEGVLPVVERKAKPQKSKKKPKAEVETDDEDVLNENSKRTKLDAAHHTADKRTDLQPHVPAPASRSPLGAKVAAAVTAQKSEFAPNRSRDDDEEPRASSNAATDYDDDESEASSGDRKLSRAERKRLKKLKRQQSHDD